MGEILVIDDDPQVLAVAVKRLESPRGADLFVCEAQYTEEGYPTRKGWGHSTTEDALRVAAQAAVRNWLFSTTILHTTTNSWTEWCRSASNAHAVPIIPSLALRPWRDR